MKHIKKFSKSISVEFLNSFFKEVDILFEEHDKLYLSETGTLVKGFVGTSIENKLRSRVYNGDYNEYVDTVSELAEFHKKIQEAIQHTLDEFDCGHEVEIMESGESNSWVDTIKKEIWIKFY